MWQVALVCEVRSSHVFDVLEPFLQDATLVSGARLGRPLFGALVAALLDGLGKNIALVKVHTTHRAPNAYTNICTKARVTNIYADQADFQSPRKCRAKLHCPLKPCAVRFLGLVCSVIATTR